MLHKIKSKNKYVCKISTHGPLWSEVTWLSWLELVLKRVEAQSFTIQRHPHSPRFHVCGEEFTKQQPSASKKRTRELFCYVKFPPCGSLAVVGGGHTCSFWWTIRNNPLVPSSARKKSLIYGNKKNLVLHVLFLFSFFSHWPALPIVLGQPYHFWRNLASLF